MKPIRSLSCSIAVSVAVLPGLAFFASGVPVSVATDIDESDTAPSGQPESTDGSPGPLVEITHVRNDTGKIVVLVFDDADAFGSLEFSRAVAFTEIPAQTGVARARFPELSEGTYAVALFHDENGDYDLNMDGDYPVEGYGTSGAESAYDEPDFDEAAVSTSPVAVRMHYLMY